MGGGHVAVQVEDGAVHPLDVGCQRPQVRQPRVDGQHGVVDQRRRAFQRHGADAVVGLHDAAQAVLDDLDAGEAPALHQDLLHLGVVAVLHALGFEPEAPGVDPDEVGRPVEHAVGGTGRGVDDGQHQLHEDVADGARAGRARLGRDERARDARGEELLVGRRALGSADEVPPAGAFVLAQAAFGAAGQDLPDAGAEEGQVLGREVGGRAEGHHDVAQKHAGVGRRAREGGGHDEGRLAELGDAHACRRHQVIGDLAAVQRRDAAHGVHDVLVEAGEEAEAVLARQVVLDRRHAVVGQHMAGAGRALVGNRDAARLAAGDVAAFEHRDLEPTLDELVRGAHAGDAAAQDDDASQAAARFSGGARRCRIRRAGRASRRGRCRSTAGG